MIPIGDRLRPRRFPLVNYGLIAANFLLFFYELTLANHPVIVRGFVRYVAPRDAWIQEWGLVPARLMRVLHAPGAGHLDQLLRLVTSQFIHAGWLHVLGNMLFLWVFGDNIEDALGRVRYLLFYLGCGVIAGLVQVLVDQRSTGAIVGASGAIAGVLGAFLAIYPRADVRVIIPIFIIPLPARVPAAAVMIVWFLSQVISLAPTADATGGNGSVAYAAHIGGFIAGLLLGRLVATRRRSLPAP